MPRTPTEISIFIAWPGDNKLARDRAVRIIGELDTTFHRHHGVRIVAKDWKTHARPAGGNPQQNINNQVGRYDIFVGLLWTRLGMNAGRGKTGFEEEYAIARSQWRRRKSSLMLYVRTSSPPKLNTIDAGQLQQVRDFVTRVQKKYQALYWTYGTLAEFERELRQHLTDEIHARLNLSTAPPIKADVAQQTKELVVTKAVQKKKPRATTPRTPRLLVPSVPRFLTDTDRETFARKALTTTLREFRAAAKVFNSGHPHATIAVAKEGDDAFTAVGETNGKLVVSARVRLEAPKWNSSWTLYYETAYQGYSFDGTPHYQTETQVTTTDDGYTPTYSSSYSMFSNGQKQLEEPIDVAKVFWARFVRTFTQRR